MDITISWNGRLCKVRDEYGYFQTWEYYAEPIREELFIGGAPAGMFSRVYGIVEFKDRVERVNPIDISFQDEENMSLWSYNKKEKE